MRHKLSVVMALFNTLPYLKKCAESILSQSFEDFELIVVDNLSDDGSYEYMKTLADKDRRIILHQRAKHGNAATSREIGRQLAEGQFLTYVDSDDSIRPGMYDRLMGCVSDTGADIAVCNFNMVFPDRILENYCRMEDEVLDLSAGYEPYFFRNFCASPPNNYLWSRVIRRELYDGRGITVPDVEISEDTIFTMLCTSVARRVAHISDSYYDYYQREDSAVRELVRNDNVVLRYVQAFEKVVSMVTSLGLEDLFRRILPFYAYTRVRSIIFYKGLVRNGSAHHDSCIRETIQGSSLPQYLRMALDGDCLMSYAEIHGNAAAEEIRKVIQQCL